MKLSTLKLTGVLSIAVITILSACDPVPRRTLSTEEKIADLYWIYSQYGENYAPLEMKQKLHNFDYEQLKSKYLEDAKQTKTNNEFYDLMFKFVAEFKDAHNSAALTNASLPNRAQVAFLGFSGARSGDNLFVKKLLPTISKDSNYPIQKGDLITKIDGKSLKDAVKEQLLPLRNLGNEESNYTGLMNKLFTRVSTMNGLPQSKDAVITFKRSDKEYTVTLPWVTKDLFQFQAEQEKAKQATASVPAQAAKESDANFLMLGDAGSVMRFNFIGFDGRIQKPVEEVNKVMARIRKSFSDGFRILDSVAEWSPRAEDEAPKTPMQLLKEERSVLEGAIYLSESKTYPAYVAPVKLLDKDGKETDQTKLVGYIYLDTFSPEGDEKDVVKEFKATLDAMQRLGVNDLMIDTINNGGGSLVLGMKLAQALSNKKIEMPKMQFRLSDTWMDEFEKESRGAASDAEGESALRILNEMTERKNAGIRLSKEYSAEVLAPFSINPNLDLKKPMKIVLLVNEMCASMCDIFAATLQDNKMATIIGSQTMGAGGNVVNHQQAPNSHLDLRQTESLLVRKDGSYLENNGVKPDKALEVNTFAEDKYADVITAATDFIIGKKEATK